jgi:hypothetical protein
MPWICCGVSGPWIFILFSGLQQKKVASFRVCNKNAPVQLQQKSLQQKLPASKNGNI